VRGDISELLTPPVITGLVADLLLVPPAAIPLLSQHGHWRKAEQAAPARRPRYTHTKPLQAALERVPEGHFVWFHQRRPSVMKTMSPPKALTPLLPVSFLSAARPAAR
jgi:hypothetical protein